MHLKLYQICGSRNLSCINYCRLGLAANPNRITLHATPDYQQKRRLCGTHMADPTQVRAGGDYFYLRLLRYDAMQSCRQCTTTWQQLVPLLGCYPSARLHQIVIWIFTSKRNSSLSASTYKSTDMCHLTTGIHPEKCVVRRFRRCAKV